MPVLYLLFPIRAPTGRHAGSSRKALTSRAVKTRGVLCWRGWAQRQRERRAHMQITLREWDLHVIIAELAHDGTVQRRPDGLMTFGIRDATANTGITISNTTKEDGAMGVLFISKIENCISRTSAARNSEVVMSAPSPDLIPLPSPSAGGRRSHDPSALGLGCQQSSATFP